MTQQALGERAHLSSNAIAALERGRRTTPRPGTVVGLANALQLGPAQRARLVAAASGLQPRLSQRPPSLPEELTSFVGRDREVVELTQLLGRARLLTLTGSGGVGKTRLALALVARVERAYADGVWLVELASLADPRLVPQTLAGALGVSRQAHEALPATLRAAIGQRELLLVVDNCEHLVAACAELLDILLRGCQSLVILATSREPLGIAGETTWRVPSLGVPGRQTGSSVASLLACESVQLFTERAQAVMPRFELSESNALAVAKICRRLDGVPLAIELAAARVRAFAPEQIASRLENHAQLLVGGSRTAPQRQQTLDATLDWSYNLLSLAERRMLERLSVFAGGWTLEAAEAVCFLMSSKDGQESANVFELLTSLIDKSLVIAEPAADGSVRYRLLEPVRQYALQRLARQAHAVEVHDQHAQFFVCLAESLEPRLQSGVQTRLDRLELEHDNLRTALRWLIERGSAERAQRLAAPLSRFWYQRGDLGEARGWLDEVRRLPGGSGSAATRAKLLYGVGLLALYQGDYAAAQAPAEESLRLWRDLDDRVEIAFSMYLVGMVHWSIGDHDMPRQLWREGFEIGHAAGDHNVAALNLRGIADAALDEGEYADAKQHAEHALALATDPRIVHHALRVLGEVCYWQGELAPAERYLEGSLVKAREFGGRPYIAAILPSLAHVSIGQAEYGRAHALLAESLVLARDLGDRQVIGRGLEGCARLALVRDQPLRALRLLGAAETLRQAAAAKPSRVHQKALAGWRQAAALAAGAVPGAMAFAEGRTMSPEQAVAMALDAAQSTDEPTGAVGLTSRERQVSALVAEGLSNSEIATRLVISPRTVESHVSNAMGKLGVASRARLAAWAVKHQLAPRCA